jgi:hypothetical protein
VRAAMTKTTGVVISMLLYESDRARLGQPSPTEQYFQVLKVFCIPSLE